VANGDNINVLARELDGQRKRKENMAGMKSIDNTNAVVEYSMGLEGNKPSPRESSPAIDAGEADY
jgi:hypothetical protein